MSIEALRAALAALEWASDLNQVTLDYRPLHDAIASVRAALAQPSAERKPLTDEQIAAIGKRMLGIQFGNTDVDFARAIERAVRGQR